MLWSEMTVGYPVPPCLWAPPVAVERSCLGPSQRSGLGRRRDPAVWLLSRLNCRPSLADFPANTTYWAPLKQPYKQKVPRAGPFAVATDLAAYLSSTPVPLDSLTTSQQP